MLVSSISIYVYAVCKMWEVHPERIITDQISNGISTINHQAEWFELYYPAGLQHIANGQKVFKLKLPTWTLSTFYSFYMDF